MTAQTVYSAQVLEGRDPENLGRVQVRVSGLDDANSVLWARVSTPMVGPLRNTGFTPAPGDEVVVVFERGDLRTPIVVGALWNGKDQPPDSNTDKGSASGRTARSPRS
jgi:uncharacterized protein involved in type VI secretion and phage assembly